MIAFIKGIIVDIETDRVILESNNIGYNIFVPASVIKELPSLGKEIKFFTYMHVREDNMTLFGFLEKEDLKIFKLLISVSGIGPKGGLNILSILSPDELRLAVCSNDYKAISKAPGVGPKTSQKLILELKDKLDIKEVLTHGIINDNIKKPKDSNVNDSILALTELGYPSSAAYKAVMSIENVFELTTNEIIKKALKLI